MVERLMVEVNIKNRFRCSKFGTFLSSIFKT